MNTPAPDDNAVGNGDRSPVLPHRQPEYRTDDAVTEIMPVIAPWPAPGEAPPAPPKLDLPDPSTSAPRQRDPVGSAHHQQEPESGPASIRSGPVPVADPPAVPMPPPPPDWPDAIGDGPREPVRPEDAKTVILGRMPPGAVPAVAGSGSSSGSTDPARSGPVVLEADGWDEAAPAVALPPIRTRRVPNRIRVVVGLVLVALAAAVGLPFAFSADPAKAPTAAGLPTALDQPPEQISAASAEPTTPGDVASAVGMTPQPTASAPSEQAAGTGGSGGAAVGESSSAAAATTTTTNPAAGSGTSTSAAAPPAAQPPAAPPPPPFAPVTFEAEAGTLTGSAGIWDGYPNASGGRVVRNVGFWGGTPGTLRINNVNIPSTGAYTLTIYFVHIDNERERSATITVSGNPAFSTNFIGGTACCQVKVITNITMTAGTHTITFANPTGHAPSFDRVVVSRT